MNSDEEIYRAYPRHLAKIAAKKAIARAVRELAKEVGENQARQQIMEATQAFANSPAGQRGAYTPHPSTWFNQGRYLDDQIEWFYGDNNGKNNGIAETRNDRTLREALAQLDFDAP